MVLFMPASVYGFSAGDKLLLRAVATLVGGCASHRLGIAAFRTAMVGNASAIAG